MNPVTEAPVNPGADSTTPPQHPAGEQPVNWEARFKGLQTTFNALQATVTAKDAALNTVKAEYDQFKTGQTEALKTAQLEISDWANKYKSVETERNTTLTRAQQLQADLDKQLARGAQRQKLVAAEGTDLVEAFEAGHLNLDGVADDALPAALASFRSLAAKIAGQVNTGTTPQTPSVSPTANPTGLSLEQLGEWIMKPENFMKPEYDSMHDAYLSLAPKS